MFTHAPHTTDPTDTDTDTDTDTHMHTHKHLSHCTDIYLYSPVPNSIQVCAMSIIA